MNRAAGPGRRPLPRLGRRVLGLILAALVCGGSLPAPVRADASAGPRVRLEFFFTAGCDDCRTVREDILPLVLEVFGESVQVVPLDLAAATNYARLAAYQDRLAPEGNDSVSVVLNGRVFLGGVPAIRARLYAEVERLAFEAGPGGDVAPQESGESLAAVESRFQSWSIWTIAGVGLADGLNPCAFATLIFFMTLLTAARQTRDKLLVVGIGFCLAVFLTYLALGLGAFHALRALTAYGLVSVWLRRVMVGLLMVLAFLSFRDAWVFRRRGQAGEVALQLPDRIKRRIHDAMRTALTARRLFLASLGIGFAVTLLESVCTGQMYLPALAYLAGHPELGRRAWVLLLLYNAMFVLPQVVVFVVAYRGAGSRRLLEWSRAHVAPAKVLLGVFFVLLAVLLAAT
jgi:hypothetical protein